MILNNSSEIISRLGLERSLVLSCAPYRKAAGGAKDEDAGGCQIDLLIQLKQSMYVVEVKRQGEIGLEVVDEVRRKIRRLPNPKGLSIRPVLVYDGRLSPSVREQAYFVALIEAADLLR